MPKNNKGFTLMEILMVLLIIGTLAAIGIPQYRNSVSKTKVAVYIPIMRALQDDVINYYNLNNELPTSLSQLPLDRREYTVKTATHWVHRTDDCEVKMNGGSTKYNINITCGLGWELEYSLGPSEYGYSPSGRIFRITGNDATNAAIAKNFGWQQNGSNTSEYIVR